MCMFIACASFLLMFLPSFIQRTFIYLSKVGYMLGTEPGASALFLNGHVLVFSGMGQNRHPSQYSLVISAKMGRSIRCLCGSTEITLFIK